MNSLSNNSNAILIVNLKNLIYNYKLLKKLAPNSIIAPCIKANAYGLGALEICKVLKNKGCKVFFVATPDEAISIRNNFKDVEIYLLNGVNEKSDFLKMIKNKITLIINNKYQLNVIKNNKKAREKISCGIHVDTGMNRLGFSQEHLQYCYKYLKENLNIKLVISHLISSEKKTSSNNTQLEKFNKIKKNFSFCSDTIYSLSNSNGIFLNKKYYYDMIRVGGLLYGLSLNKKNLTKNVISLKAKIIQIQEIKKGQSIGYGANFVTKKNSIIATLSIGYADGLPRNYNGYAIYKSKKVPFVGNISMDLSCIDLTGIKNIVKYDWVEIFGSSLSILDFSNRCNTISYEISSNIGSRVKKLYLK
ncbi:MAG: alanine racemase [Rickettsiales bacterium TMED254]|nr:alanine racemase [Rickettsiales bacterium]RPF77046.1 MAG: alanine racemase [Rickettsiales bacterium TMED254]|tara:strand:+ start:1486 stop:2568 length:1083 start_codon:yes stop_codon:yes gene_type:complete